MIPYTPRNYFMGLIKVQFSMKTDEGNIVGEKEANTVYHSPNKYLTALDLKNIQESAMVNVANSLGEEDNEFKIINSLILNIVHLGEMSPQEFNTNEQVH